MDHWNGILESDLLRLKIAVDYSYIDEDMIILFRQGSILSDNLFVQVVVDTFIDKQSPRVVFSITIHQRANHFPSDGDKNRNCFWDFGQHLQPASATSKIKDGLTLTFI